MDCTVFQKHTNWLADKVYIKFILCPLRSFLLQFNLLQNRVHSLSNIFTLVNLFT